MASPQTFAWIATGRKGIRFKEGGRAKAYSVSVWLVSNSANERCLFWSRELTFVFLHNLEELKSNKCNNSASTAPAHYEFVFFVIHRSTIAFSESKARWLETMEQ